MNRFVLVALVLLVSVTGAAAQPKHGDLVFSLGIGNYTGGYTGFMDPARPGVFTTIAAAPANFFHNGLRMAPDNASLVVSEASGTNWGLGHLIRFAPGGKRSTLAANVYQCEGFELDHDGTFVVSATDWTAIPYKNHLLRVTHSTGAVVTFTTLTSQTMGFNEVAIDRDPGAPVYVVANWETGTLLAPKILGVDGRGRFTTIVAGAGDPLRGLTGIELHPRSGNYLTTGKHSTEVNRVTKAGRVTPLTVFARPNAVKIGQDDVVWVGRGVGAPQWILQYDLTANAVVTYFQLGLPTADWISGVEIYGSQPLVCSQPPSAPRAVGVTVQSRHPLAGGAAYILAASLARRPGLRFANGEWLDLDVTHPLFFTSAFGWAPTVFVNFQGALDQAGNNLKPIRVNIPPGLPNGIAIFVGGVIYKGANTIQVTNTHWFVLP